MKNIIKLTFFVYWTLTAGKLHACRHLPTCSQYAYEAFENFGLLKALALSLRRILSCHPLSKRPMYDPLPTIQQFNNSIASNAAAQFNNSTIQQFNNSES